MDRPPPLTLQPSNARQTNTLSGDTMACRCCAVLAHQRL